MKRRAKREMREQDHARPAAREPAARPAMHDPAARPAAREPYEKVAKPYQREKGHAQKFRAPNHHEKDRRAGKPHKVRAQQSNRPAYELTTEAREAMVELQKIGIVLSKGIAVNKGNIGAIAIAFGFLIGTNRSKFANVIQTNRKQLAEYGIDIDEAFDYGTADLNEVLGWVSAYYLKPKKQAREVPKKVEEEIVDDSVHNYDGMRYSNWADE